MTGQPTHAKDRDAAVAAAGAFIDMLTEPSEDQEIGVSMYGSLSWNHPEPDEFTGANVSITAAVKPKV